jgi:hypothetical protein
MQRDMRTRFGVALLALVLAGCGTTSERVSSAANACDVRLPTAKERAAAKPLERKFARFERNAKATLRRLKARDDGSRDVAADVLAKGQAQRRAEGLDASVAATRAVILAAPGVSEEMGFPLTDAEFDLMYIRSNIGNHTRLAVRYARTCLRGQSTTLFYGGDARGQFIALPLTTGSASARRELLKRVAIDRSFVRIPCFRTPSAALKAAQQRIVTDLAGAVDVRSVGIDASGTHVEVKLDPYTTARVAELRERYGAVIDVLPADG